MALQSSKLLPANKTSVFGKHTVVWAFGSHSRRCHSRAKVSAHTAHCGSDSFTLRLSSRSSRTHLHLVLRSLTYRKLPYCHAAWAVAIQELQQFLVIVCAWLKVCMLLMWCDMQVCDGPVHPRQSWFRREVAITAAAGGGEAVLGPSAGLHHASNAVYRSAWPQDWRLERPLA